MSRLILRDDQWQRVQDWLPGKATDCGVTAKDNRSFLDLIRAISKLASGASQALAVFSMKYKPILLQYSLDHIVG